MKKNKVLIFGGVGAATSVAYNLLDAQKNKHFGLEFHGLINDKDGQTNIQGLPVIGGLKDVPRLIEQGYSFINTIYKIDGMRQRVNLFESLNIPMSQLATFIHPQAYVAPNTEIGPGSVIYPLSSVASNARLGKCVRIASGAAIGHDSIMEDHSFAASNATVGSHSHLKKVSYAGMRSTILGKLKIEEYSVIGMGSVVTKAVDANAVVVGNPARFLRYVSDRPI